MSDPTSAGFPLYEKLVGDDAPGNQHDLDDKMALLTKFKGHVKKELLYVPAIRSYFASLFFVLSTSSGADKLLILAHSSLCYLVKRVAMQVPSHLEDSQLVKDLLIHLFSLEEVNNGLLQRKNVWTSSCRALEAVYLVQSALLQSCLKELLRKLTHKRRILLVIDEYLQMAKRNSSSSNNDNLLMEIFNVECLEGLASSDRDDHNNKLVLEILQKNFKNDDEMNNFAQQINEDSSSFKIPIFDTEYELNRILKEYGTPEVSSGRPGEIQDRNFESMSEVSDFLSSLMIPFESMKETEQNWKARQSNLTQFRDLIQNNRFIRENPLSFLMVCKELQVIDCIGKAVMSLRTTLSMTACHVIRTLLKTFNQSLDLALLDQIFVVLKSLLSTAKKMSSTAAFSCLIVMFIYTGFYNKLFQNCMMLINEKSVSVRSCSAVLLRIILIKFTDHKKLDNSLVYIEEWLKKGITDAQTSVREPMRVTFWYYYKSHPANAKNFLNTHFSPQLKKAIELSVPSHLNIRYTPTHSVTPSSSSSDSMSRSNGHLRKYPSYAKPTQSSNASLQRLSNQRSASEYIPNEIDTNAQLKRKISAPPPSLKRPASLTNERKISHNDNEMENYIQIDLTEDISTGHSSSLISKYLGKEQTNFDDLEQMYQNLTSSNQSAVTDALQILQKRLLTESSMEHKQPIDFRRIVPLLRMLMVRAPSELKSFLTISTFCQSIPFNYVIEIHAINFMEWSDQITSGVSQHEILQTTSKLIMWLHSNAYEKEDVESVADLSLHYMKYKQFIYNLCFRLLCNILQNDTQMERRGDANSKEDYSSCLSALVAIWGQEFDEKLYFDTFYLFYLNDKGLFKQAMNKVESVSTVLQICNKLAARDPENEFDYEAVIGEKRSLGQVADASEDMPEDRRYMEMTMVNPFRQNRIASDGSVIHHESERLESEGNEEAREAKISEMTKVVSVYEVPTSQDEEVLVDKEGDLKMTETAGPSLSDIFTNSTEEGNFTVKFSKDPPSIINPSTGSSSADASRLTKDTTIDGHSIDEDGSKVRHASPFNALSDHEAKILSQGIDRIDITPKAKRTANDVSSFKESSEILSRAVCVTSRDRTYSQGSEILNNSLPGTLTFYEINQLCAITDDAGHLGDQYVQMREAITRIKNRSFTIRHLTNLTAPLLTFSLNEDLKKWLEKEDGYEDLLQLSIFLLRSEVESSSIPMNMACKCILLVECLILLNKHLGNVAPLTSVTFRDIWNLVIEMLRKLDDYSNEVYVLLHDLRDLLIERDFFSATDVTTIVSILATQSQEAGPRVKETFLMETLSCIIAKQVTVVKKHQLPEVIQMMQYFLESEFTEWRCASASVMANILRHLALTEAAQNDTDELFSSLSERQVRLIKLIAFQ